MQTTQSNPPAPRADGLIPYDWNAARHPMKHVQDMLVREVDMDENSKFNGAAFSDRLCQRYGQAAYDGICERYFNCKMSYGSLIEDWALEAPEAELLKFGKEILAIDGCSEELRGFRIIRQTAHNGCPVYLFQAVYARYK